MSKIKSSKNNSKVFQIFQKNYWDNGQNISCVVAVFFDEDTSTFSYVLWHKDTKKAAVIDSVLNYNKNSGSITENSLQHIISYIKQEDLTLEWILETHIHADHITAGFFLKKYLGGKIAMGKKVKDVLKYWVPIFNTHEDTPLNGSQFDYLFDHEEIFFIGSIAVRVVFTPGHTPACVSYNVGPMIFVGDTLFMPDIGTARTDFPGGSSEILYHSIHKIFQQPPETEIFICHDYPPESRGPQCFSTLKDQKENNVLINESISKQEFCEKREKKDKGKEVPALLFPSLQINLRGGSFGLPEKNGLHYIKIPINSKIK